MARPPGNWWLHVADWTPLDLVAVEAPPVVARLLGAGADVGGVARGLELQTRGEADSGSAT